MRLIRSEWIKATSTKMWWILSIVAVALTVLSSLPILLVSGMDTGGSGGTEVVTPPLTDDYTMRSLWATMGSASIIALILGILSFTGEYRHETITDTFLTEPRRGHLIAAKALVHALLGALLAVVTCLTAAAIILSLLPGREHAPYDWGAIGQVAAGVVLCYACYAVLGVAVGALITNQIAAIVLALLWVMLIEALIVAFKPEIGKWLPGGAASGILGGQSLDGTDLLPAWLGALVLIGYSVVFAAAAALTTLRRDIT
jgi:ABC-2 type transport system permease protein